jgi:transposase-like protein
MDEVFLRTAGRLQYLWRALDRDSVLDSLEQPRGDNRAAKRFFRKRIGGLQYVSRAIITDRLGSGATAKRELLTLVEHRRDR